MTTHNIVNGPEGFECTQCKQGWKVLSEIPEKCSNPFSVYITYKNNPPTVAEAAIGGQVANEFFTLVGPDAEGLPDCIESVIIKRTE